MGISDAMRRGAKLSGCMLLALLAPSAPALAQEAGPPPAPVTGDAPPPTGIAVPGMPDVDQPSSGERIVYTPADFTRFAPRNALQMLQNVPGFRIEAESQERGLGQASGNVLINGQRPSSKSDSTSSLLTRIPAANVERIEIVDGSTLNIPGLSGQVANVIAKSSGGLRGRFEWRPQWSSGPARTRLTQGDISVSGKAGRLDYSAALRNDSFYGGGEGETLIVDALGVLDPRATLNRNTLEQPRASANLKYDLGNGARANLNASGSVTIMRSEEFEKRTAVSALPAFTKQVNSSNDAHGYEISGDVEFALGPGRLKLIGLDSADHGEFLTRSRFANFGRSDTGSEFLRASDEGERIGRGEYRWHLWGADWQLSLEGAFNRLDNVASLFTLTPAGSFVEVPFPSGSGGVREARYESILSYSRPLAKNLSLQLALGGEYSTLSQTGANALSRSFKRPKGSLDLAWTASESLNVSLRVARRVGQLSFADFLASVNLSDGNSNSGNNQLRPQQSWEFELEASRNFGAWGSATVKLFHYLIEDYITIIPIPAGASIGESRGNVPTATDTGINLTGTLRLDPLGVKGAKIDVRALLDRSRVTDPVTGIARGFDRSRSSEFQIDLRHDIPMSDWAWGAQFRETDFLPYYRVTERGIDYSLARFGAVFVEHKDLLGLTVQLRAANLLDPPSVLDRAVFAGPRNTGRLLFTETRARRSGRLIQATVSGSF